MTGAQRLAAVDRIIADIYRTVHHPELVEVSEARIARRREIATAIRQNGGEVTKETTWRGNQ